MALNTSYTGRQGQLNPLKYTQWLTKGNFNFLKIATAWTVVGNALLLPFFLRALDKASQRTPMIQSSFNTPVAPAPQETRTISTSPKSVVEFSRPPIMPYYPQMYGGMWNGREGSSTPDYLRFSQEQEHRSNLAILSLQQKIEELELRLKETKSLDANTIKGLQQKIKEGKLIQQRLKQLSESATQGVKKFKDDNIALQRKVQELELSKQAADRLLSEFQKRTEGIVNLMEEGSSSV